MTHSECIPILRRYSRRAVVLATCALVRPVVEAA